MEITTVYQKERSLFGRPTQAFQNTDAFLLDEFAPDPDIKSQHIERNPSVMDVQAKPEMSEHHINTERFSYCDMTMFHSEGGWPKDVDPTEKDQTLRFRKKVEKDEDYIKQVKSMCDLVEVDLKLNSAIDIYQEYFMGEFVDHSSEPPSAKTLSVFKDPEEVKRTVSNISWYPDGGKKLAVSFAIMQFQDRRTSIAGPNSYIWDVNNPNTPEMALVPPSPLCCLEFNPKDPHLLVGGSYNGLVSSFDTRKGESAVDSSLIESSHRDPAWKVTWLAGKTAFECCSTSTDGQVLFWDIRKLQEPTESIQLEDKANNNAIMGGVSMEYSAAGGPTKFLIGSEQGKVISCSRKGKTPADKIGMLYEGHCGPVYGLHRNAFYPKYFLTVGDWTVRLWNEEIRNPIMTSKYFKDYLSDAQWSPTRPGVFVTTKYDGTLDVWDYFYKQNDPTLSLQVDGDGLKTVKIQDGGSLLAAGSVDGSVYMLELCEGLATMQPNEKNSVMHMLERESKREKNLETRAKELRQKEKRAAEMQSSEPTEKVPWEETVKEIEEGFWNTIGSKDPADATGDGVA